MWPVSQAFLDAVAHGHTAPVRMEVRDPVTGDSRTLVDTLDAPDVGAVLSGSVSIDRTRDIRRTMGCQLVDLTGDLTPTEAEDLLAPFGNELHVERGIVLPGGTAEMVPLIIARLTGVKAHDSRQGVVIDVSGSDRSIIVQVASWESTYIVPAGIPRHEAIADGILDRYPDAEINLPEMGDTSKAVFDGTEGDPFADFAKIARDDGWELHVDASGVFVADRPATPDSDPVVAYEEGDQAVMLDLAREISTARNVYNGVIATSEHPGLSAPLRSVVWDDDPGSPTYYLGKFRKRPRPWSTPLVETQGQLDAAAQSMLDGLLGANEDLQFTQIVNPALTANDVVAMTRQRLGLDAVRMVLDVLEIPLTADVAQTASGRRRFL